MGYDVWVRTRARSDLLPGKQNTLEMELGRQAERGGIGTGVIFDHISHSVQRAYRKVDTSHPL